MEAMLAGKPVIGSARGATGEIIQEGRTGLLYEWGNIRDLTKKIQFLHDNPKERMRIGDRAQQWAWNKFTQERYAREIFGILSEIAPGFPGARSSCLPEEIAQIMHNEGTQSDTSVSRPSQAKKMAS
jgi:hypothetical protein